MHAQPILAYIIAVFLLQQAAGDDTPRLSPTGYIEYWPGTLPIILSAPHGGLLAPKELPDRTAGKLIRDSNTIELSHAIRAAMQKRFGAAPALIICRVSRHKLDCNREIIEAAQGNPLAEKAWREYHAFIDEAEAELLRHHPRGLYIDIHGHAHEKQRIEIGYALTEKEIQLPDAELNALAVKSTLRSLASSVKLPFAELLRGKTSLGGLLEALGIPSVPAPTMNMENDDPYFSGGYDIRQHGSISGGKIDALQLEYPRSFRESAEAREKTSEALIDALDAYFKAHYGAPLMPMKK
jgi:hypothetical protein